jgi:hypothetical protein
MWIPAYIVYLAAALFVAWQWIGESESFSVRREGSDTGIA